MEILVIISLIFSIYTYVKLNKLEKNLIRDKAEKIQMPEQYVANVPLQSVIKQDTANHPPQQPGLLERVWMWYIHEWPLKTGALFILLGFIWLVTYAFMNDWIGPVGRITLGLLSGAIILYGGELRMRKIVSQGITLVGLGAAVMTMTVFAAQEIYQMFPSIVALCLIGLTMVFVAFISLRHTQLSLAVISLFIGLLAPVLIGSRDANIIGLYNYLLVITFSFIWLARFTNWRILTTLALFGISIYSLGTFFNGALLNESDLLPSEFVYMQFVACTLTSAFFLTTILSLIRNKRADLPDLVTASAVGMFSLGWINGLVLEEYKSIVIAICAIFYSLGSYIVYKRTRVIEAVYIYTAIAATMLAIATAYAFDGPILVIAFSMQALMLTIVGVELFESKISRILFFYFALPALTAIDIWTQTGAFISFTDTSFVALTVVVLTFLLGGMYFYYRKKEQMTAISSIPIFLIIVGSLFGLVWIWRVVTTAIDAVYLAHMVILVIYSTIGMSTYLYGESQKRTILYKFGLGVLVYVVARLLLVEVWDMELAARIITFFFVGILFMASVLLKKRSQDPQKTS